MSCGTAGDGGSGSCGGGGTPRSADAANGEVGRSLESYRREVTILRNSLKQRDAREADLAEGQRRLKSEHRVAKEEWDAQVAGLVCEVQDLEQRNRQLEAALRALAGSSSAAASTTALASSVASTSGAPTPDPLFDHLSGGGTLS